MVIIGAGPIGLACGIEAEKAGLNYTIIEKGCLVNALYNYPINMTFFSTSELLEIGNVPFISHGHKPTRSEALEYYRRVSDHWSLKINLYEAVTSINSVNSSFEIHTSKQIHQAENIIIATGFYGLPNLMGVEGEELPKVKHYYDEPHPYFRQKVVVVGSANSAVDVALETYRKGAEVTMVIREDGIGRRVKYWVKPDIENRIKEGSIKAYFNTTIKKITPSTVEIQTPDGDKTLENDFVLAMTGYVPDFSFLQSIGIDCNNDDLQPAHDPETFETNIPRIYLAGVVCGGMNTNSLFIENSRYHAVNIINDITGK
ncbi:MAG: YpdA family putative bacillithiol disulfide reductase [Bacteroidetes bacterium]|nr:MAG: YpdA family putative bacillithiol disulfide reductase [Bacteroidota bacterium]